MLNRNSWSRHTGKTMELETGYCRECGCHEELQPGGCWCCIRRPLLLPRHASLDSYASCTAHSNVGLGISEVLVATWQTRRCQPCRNPPPRCMNCSAALLSAGIHCHRQQHHCGKRQLHGLLWTTAAAAAAAAAAATKSCCSTPCCATCIERRTTGIAPATDLPHAVPAAHAVGPES
jgi:hypothetical protein